MRHFRSLLATLVAILTMGSVAANPIPSPFSIENWGAFPIYQSNSPYLGAFTFQPPTTPGGSYVVSVTFTPYPSGPLGYNDTAWRPGSTNEVYLAAPFQVNVGIIDNASGMSGVVPVNGKAFIEWLHLGNGSWVVAKEWISQVGVPGEITLGLNEYTGANQYTVSIVSDAQSNWGSPIGYVEAALATPEPGTLGLVCCGLAPLATALARSLRRRQWGHATI
jgi:hypothetical protein